MPFAMTGTADFSAIESKLQALQSQINSLKVPPITVPAPNMGNFFNAIDKAEAKTIKVKSQIEPPTSVGGGFSSFLNSEKGKFANVGKEMGQSLQMGMQSQFGQAGGMFASLAGAMGPAGQAVAVITAATIGIGAAATQAAMKWEDMKTSIGRTTGLGGDNLEDLMNQLQGLRMEFGITGEAASSMVEQAGSIGVGQKKMESGDLKGYKQEILDFTKATAILQGAWGMSAEATSSGIGKMGSVTLGQWNIQRKARGEEEMSWADYAYKVGGVTDNLANAMGSSEEEIVTAMKNSSGAIAKWAPDENTYGKWEAMASFLIDTGASAGEAGTQIERVSQKMEQNGADAAKLLGLDQTGLNTKLKTDFMGTVQELGQAVAAMPATSRPDLFKMFGLEGASMIGKVVADIEAGTGKLQAAFALAAKPGNVTKGYEDVADNASKQFARIGEAFQVSLEKMGGVLLPFVSKFAGAIADGLIGLNQFGTSAYEKIANLGPGASEWLNKATGGALGYDEMADPNSAIGKRLAEAKAKEKKDYADALKATPLTQAEIGTSGASIQDYGMMGQKSGIGYIDALNSELNTGLPKTFTNAYLATYDVAGRAAKELAKTTAKEFTKEMASQMEAGMMDTGKTYINSLGETKIQYESWDSINNAKSAAAGLGGRTYDATAAFKTGDISSVLGNKMQWAEWEANAKDAQNRIKIDILENGKKIGEEFVQVTFGNISESEFDSQIRAISKKYEEMILDLPKFVENVKGEMSSALEDVLSDGVVSWTEKDQIGNYIKQLDDIQVRAPVEFEAAGLTKIRDDLFKTANGIPITFYTGELETNFALWLSKNADMYQGIYKATGAVPTEGEERKIHDILKTSDDRTKELYGYIDAASKGTIEDIEVLPEVINELGNTSPELLVLQGTTQRLEAAQKLYGDQVRITGNSFSVLDEKGNTLANSHLRTSVASDIASGGLTTMASAAYAAAHALNSIGSGGPASSAQWVQSRLSDNRLNNAFAGNYSQGNTTFSGFNTGSISSVSDFGGLLSGKMGFNIPKLGQVSKVSARPGGTLAFVGEKGEAEYVIPVSALKGLYPESKTIDKGSMQYQMGEQYFNDYPSPSIKTPTGYRWSHYPDAPQVQEKNYKEAEQVAWLSEYQTTTREMFTGRIREAQIAAIGKNSIVPWFARGDIKQPSWWTEAATKLSPENAASWNAKKGGNIPEIVSDSPTGPAANIKPNGLLTGNTAWATIYDDSGTCIGFNKPDPSANIKLTPRAVSFDAAAFAGVYNNDGTCIAFVAPDKNLNFKPGPGYEVGGSRVGGGGVTAVLNDIEDNTAKSADKIGLAATYTEQMATVLKSPIKGFDNGNPFGKLSSGFDSPGALVVGLSKEGYLATYDPRTDTCEGLSFVEPSPYLKTTDPFYLGLTENSPFRSDDKSPGYGWTTRAQPMNESDAQLMKIEERSYQEQQKAAKDTEKIEKNTGMTYDLMGKQYAMQQQQVLATGALVAMGGMGGGGGLGSLYGRTGGSFWGGRSVNGMGGWVGTGSTYGGGNVSWGGAAASNYASGGGGGGWGGVQWAEGGIVNDATYGVFGEAGREAFVPISDRAAGRRILPQVMRELGVRQFAQGGFSGRANVSAAIGGITINMPLNVSGSSKAEIMPLLAAHKKAIMQELPKKLYEAMKR
jgi:hypothetical protein